MLWAGGLAEAEGSECGDGKSLVAADHSRKGSQRVLGRTFLKRQESQQGAGEAARKLGHLQLCSQGLAEHSSFEHAPETCGDRVLVALSTPDLREMNSLWHSMGLGSP